MTITIAGIEFKYFDYDERGDTLFLGVDGPSVEFPEGTYDTPEGHFVELDRNGTVVAIELMCPRLLLERDGELRLTLREQAAASCTRELKPLLA